MEVLLYHMSNILLLREFYFFLSLKLVVNLAVHYAFRHLTVCRMIHGCSCWYYDI